MKKELRVVSLQLRSTDDFDQNLKNIQDLLGQLEPESTDLISLPENCLFLRLKEKQPLPLWTLESEQLKFFRDAARRLNSAIHLGSVPLKINGATYNATVWITSHGEISSPYQKIHLFDVDVQGHTPVRESEVFAFGAKPAVIDLEGWKIGLSICYDLRFVELYQYYASQEVDLILIPSAFLVPTGTAHWHVLNRARAIENQAYVVSAAQSGQNGPGRATYGHSLIVDPWGQILAEGDGVSPSILRATLKQEMIQGVKRQIPMRHHRTIRKLQFPYQGSS